MVNGVQSNSSYALKAHGDASLQLVVLYHHVASSHVSGRADPCLACTGCTAGSTTCGTHPNVQKHAAEHTAELGLQKVSAAKSFSTWVSLPVIKFAVEVVLAIQLGVSDLVDWMAP